MLYHVYPIISYLVNVAIVEFTLRMVYTRIAIRTAHAVSGSFGDSLKKRSPIRSRRHADAQRSFI
jgi:hypothetical protein